MTFRRRRLATLWVVAMFGLGVRAGAAETRVPPARSATSLDAAAQAMVGALSDPRVGLWMPAMVPAAPAPARPPAPAPRTGRVRRAAVRGALIGAGAAAAVTILAAVAYGRNEGGGICGACAWQWGAIGIGAGAGIGAGIGALVGAAAPSRKPGVWPPPSPPPGRRPGLAFAIRF
jgi:hypothetical protein